MPIVATPRMAWRALKFQTSRTLGNHIPALFARGFRWAWTSKMSGLSTALAASRTNNYPLCVLPAPCRSVSVTFKRKQPASNLVSASISCRRACSCPVWEVRKLAVPYASLQGGTGRSFARHLQTGARVKRNDVNIKGCICCILT